jgi:hypothetical protein
MVSIPKVVGVLSCGFVLCLGLSSAAQADDAASPAEELKADQSDRGQRGQEVGEKQMNNTERGQLKGAKTIKGEVLRVEYGGNYFVKGQDGKEVRLQTDQTTQMMGEIKTGDRIEAKVNQQNHALAIREADKPSAQ